MMPMKSVRIAILCLAQLLFAVSLFAAGSKESSAAATAAGGLTPVTLSFLSTPNPLTDPFTGGDPNKLPYAKIITEKLGVTLEPILVSDAEWEQKMQLLIAAGDPPDFMSGLDYLYAGGLEKAYADGVIVKISDHWGSVPNYRKILESDPEAARYARTDDGSVYSFGMFLEKRLRVVFGPMVREDLLKKAGVPLPETVDDWYVALKALKAQGVSKPFTTVRWFPAYTSFIMGAYGVSAGLFVAADGTMKYGPMESGFREYLQTWSRWIREGLVDPDYFTQEDFNTLRSQLANGEAGSTVSFISFLLQNNNGRKNNPGFQLTAVRHPSLKKGDTAWLGMENPPYTLTDQISAKSKNVERALLYEDYGYSDEGRMLFNFGVEGVTYTMDKGYPRYTPDLMKSLTFAEPTPIRLEMYAPASGLASTVQDIRYFEQIRLVLPEQKDALLNGKWTAFGVPTAVPPVSLREDEQRIYAKYADIETYADEMIQKFLLGTEPIANFGAFVANLKKLGIDEVLRVQNAALARFQKR